MEDGGNGWKRERAMRKKVEVSNRELKVEGRRWSWNEARRSWEEEEESEV